MGQWPNSSMYVARSMIEMPDRRLLATMYGVWEGDAARRSVVVQSTEEKNSGGVQPTKERVGGKAHSCRRRTAHWSLISLRGYS